MEVKKRKGKSLSAQLKAARKQTQYSEEQADRMWNNWRKCADRLEKISKIFPKQYFEITYKAMSKGGSLREYKNIILEFSAEMAVDEIEKKGYTDLKIVDIRKFG
jgi:hypothetical protein